MNTQIYEEASEWVVKHREFGLDVREKRSFDAWLRESPQHVCAYLEMSSLWEDLPSLDRSWNPTADELIGRARADDNVVSFTSPPHPAGHSSLRAEQGGHSNSALDESIQVDADPRAPALVPEAITLAWRRLTGQECSGGSAHRRRSVLYALAASILIAVAGGWVHLQRGVYTTDIGEQRSLALADGSTVELNSRSRIKVQYTEHDRRVVLLEGQALFNVAKNKSRPFVVQAGNTRVRAVGTAFDVYRKSSDTVVSVVEGRVAVRRLDGAATGSQSNGGAASSSSQTGQRPRDDVRSDGLADVPGIQAAAGEILLAAGEQVVVTPAIFTSPKRADIAAATSWTRRILVFDSSPLTDVAQEFNRYNTRRLLVEDPQLAQFHISGVFSSLEPSLLLRFLHTQPELMVEETDTEIRIRRK